MIQQPPPALRRTIWDRDSGICGICGDPVTFDPDMHIDRIVAAIRGYSDLTNLQATHGACNLRKGGRERTRANSEPMVRVTIVWPLPLYTTLRDLAANEQRSMSQQVTHVMEICTRHPSKGEHPDATT